MSNITGTNEQEAIWEAIENTNDDIVVNAGAGTGKTFTIVEASGRLPNYLKRGFLCFNKSIQKELANRLPEGVEAKHSMLSDLVLSSNKDCDLK